MERRRSQAGPRTLPRGPSDSFSLLALQVTAGGGAAAIAKTVTAPLTRVKLLMQSGSTRFTELRGGLKRVWTREGTLGLFRGNGTNVLRVMSAAAVNHGLFGFYMASLAPSAGASNTTSDVAWRTLAAATTASTSMLALYPVELVRVRISADVAITGGQRHYTGMADCLVQTVSREGLLGLYKGVHASILGVALMVAASSVTFRGLSQMAPPASEQDVTEAWWYPYTRLALASSASLVAQTLVYPLDTIRRRMQLDGFLSSATMNAARELAKSAKRTSAFRGVLGDHAGRSAPAGEASGRPTPGGRPSRTVPPVAAEAPAPPRPGAGGVPRPPPSSAPVSELAGRVSSAMQPATGALTRMAERIVHQTEQLRHSSALKELLQSPPRRYKSVWQCAREIVSQEGWPALYRGVSVNALKLFPAAVVQFVAFDLLRFLCTTEGRPADGGR